MTKVLILCFTSNLFVQLSMWPVISAENEMTYIRESNTFVNHGFINFSSRTLIDCSGTCFADKRCMSVSYHGEQNVCQLNDKDPLTDDTAEIIKYVGWMSFYPLTDGKSDKAQCEPSWHLYQDACYIIVQLDKQWEEAEEYCRINGGHLVDIGDEAEQQNVHNLVVTLSVSDRYWIGLSDRVQERIFTWSSFLPVSYLNWADFNLPLGSDCAYILVSTGFWELDSCIKMHHSVCKKAVMYPVS